MRDEKCALGRCSKPLKIAENESEVEKGDVVHFIAFSYRTFFFCSEEHLDEYAE